LKLYTWILIFLVDFTLFFVVKSIWDEKKAILSLLFYIPFQFFYGGNGLWFDLALVPAVLIVFYFLKRKNYLWAGIFWMLAFLIKQTAFWFLIPIGLGLLVNNKDSKRKSLLKNSTTFLEGVLFVFIPAVIILWLLGILPDFYYWALKFGIGVLPISQGQIVLPSLRQLAVLFFPFLVFISILFLQDKKEKTLLLVWSVAGVMGAFPRWEAFHFQSAIPFLAVMFGIVFLEIGKKKLLFKIILFVYLFSNVVLISKYVLREWGGRDRFFDRSIYEVADYIRENTDMGEKIYLLNAWDNIYMLSDTVPAVRLWIPHLSWYMEIPGIQKNIVSDLKFIKPKMIVQKEYEQNGLGSYKPKLIDHFIRENYRLNDKINDKINSYLIYFPK